MLSADIASSVRHQNIISPIPIHNSATTPLAPHCDRTILPAVNVPWQRRDDPLASCSHTTHSPSSSTWDDAALYAHSHSPNPTAVYRNLNADPSLGPGLRALPNTPRNVMPKVSYSILAQLAIAGSARLCLSAREISAAIEQRYPDVKLRQGRDWKVRVDC